MGVRLGADSGVLMEDMGILLVCVSYLLLGCAGGDLEDFVCLNVKGEGCGMIVGAHVQ